MTTILIHTTKYVHFIKLPDLLILLIESLENLNQQTRKQVLAVVEVTEFISNFTRRNAEATYVTHHSGLGHSPIHYHYN